MALTKITSNAFAASAVDSDAVGANTITTVKIADNNVTHAKLHTDMDLSSKTVTLPTISSLTVSGGNTHLDGRNSAGLTLDLAGSAHYTIREHTTDDIVKLGGTGSVNFIAHNISSGNVGIGTDSPSTKLHLYGTSGNQYIRAEATANTSRSALITLGKQSDGTVVQGFFGSVGDANQVEVATVSNHNIKFYTNNSPSGDNLVYGSNPRLWLTTPTGINGLRVYGDTTPFEFQINSGSYSGAKFTMGSTGDLSLIAVNTSGSDTYNDSPNLFLNATRWNGSANVTSFQGTIRSHARSATNADGYLGIGANANADALVIDASSADVGIGLTNPSARLHVKEAVSNTISPATAVAKFDGSGGDGLAFGNTQSAPYASWIQAGYLLDSYSPAFNNGYPIYLNPVGGDVTVGAAAAQNAKFTAKKSSVVYGKIGTSTNGHYFESQSDTNTDGFEIYQQHGSTTSRNSFIVNDNRTGSKSAAFVVRGDGRVGIGTESLSEELHIYNSTNDPYVLVDGSGGNRDSGYKINAGNGVKIMARADSTGNTFFNDNSISIIGQIGNGGYKSHIFDSEIQVGGRHGSTNPARVVVARVIEPKDLSLTSGWVAQGGQTDTVSGTAYKRPSTASNNTAFFGPYGVFPAGSYTALFRMKVASNSSTSGWGYIDVSGGAVADPVGSNPRPRVQSGLSPSSFGASNLYQYFALDFECDDSTQQIEFRWISWVGGLTDLWLDHILVVPRLNHN